MRSMKIEELLYWRVMTCMYLNCTTLCPLSSFFVMAWVWVGECFLVQAHPGSPKQRAIKRCVCVFVSPHLHPYGVQSFNFSGRFKLLSIFIETLKMDC